MPTPPRPDDAEVRRQMFAQPSPAAATPAQPPLAAAAPGPSTPAEARVPGFAGVLQRAGLWAYYHGDLATAVDSLARACQVKPDQAVLHCDLAVVYRAAERLDDAAANFRRAAELNPDLAIAQIGLAEALRDQGYVDEAAEPFRRAVELCPQDLRVHSSAVAYQACRPDATLAELVAAHAEWDTRHAAPFRSAWRPHANTRDPSRPLCLGFVSGDFQRHPVGYFFVQALEALACSSCSTICYFNFPRGDELTARIRAAAETWRDVAEMSDEGLAEQIRADGVDVLFDLSGHTQFNRLLVFARKPAPLQVSWLGYPGTNGLAAMDYVVADGWQVPPQSEPRYRERILRVADGAMCFAPPAEAPEVGPLPARERGYVTFGSFHHPSQLNGPVLGAWGEILRRVPNSRLVLKHALMDDPGVRRRCLAALAAAGVGPERVEFLGHSPQPEVLREYGRIDVALDPFPCSGPLPTCEAVWMGVPVVTCAGETCASRQALSLLSSAGLSDTVAADPAQYAELAVALAQDLPRLASRRAGQRQRMAKSPLCDGPRLADQLLTALRSAWRQWCTSRAR